MIRRLMLVTLLVLVALGCCAAPALAYQALEGSPTGLGARLARGAGEATTVWAKDLGGGVSALTAERFAGGSSVSRDVVSGIAGLQGWAACGHGSVVTVAWKAGGSVWAQTVDLATGATLYGPVEVCRDAAVAAAPGAATSAALGGLSTDGAGGAWVWCTVTPTTGLAGVGDSLVNHLSPAGALSLADLVGLTVAGGTVKAFDTDSAGGACALLGSPGRHGVAVQRYRVDSADHITSWKVPVSPYLLGATTAVAQEPLGLTATPDVLIAWREGGMVKAQRFATTGRQAWITPPTVVMAGQVKLAGDYAGGVWLVGPSGDGVVARHILGSGRESAASPSTQTGLGLAGPRVDAVTSNRAGDLFVGYSGDATSPSGISLVTATGQWSAAGPALDRPSAYSDAAPDGDGGAWMLGADAARGLLWHVVQGGVAAGAGAQLTCRPASPVIDFGAPLAVSGYLNGGLGTPLGGVRVDLLRGAAASGVHDVTQSHGFYTTTITPQSSGSWSATADVAGVGLVTSTPVQIGVRPLLTIALSHTVAGTRLTEIFTGTVRPAHSGGRIYAQKATASGWRTVASGRVDGRSRYRISWRLPFRTATYKVRVMLPEHADHAQGSTTSVRLRVAAKKG